MTLYMIGIGLWDERDISVKGLEAVRKADFIFLENYTSMLGVALEDLEKFYGKKIILADRDLVESRSREIIEPAKCQNVAFLVIGDVFGATTHTSLHIEAKQAGVDVVIIYNASILSSIGVVGLELYKFGKTTSIPFHNEHVEAPYDVLKMNHHSGLHTLMLLDIDKKHDKYMTVNEAASYLLKIELVRKDKLVSPDTYVIGIARIGSPDPLIVYAKLSDLLWRDLGGPLHCLIIPGKLHFVEEEALNQWKA